MKAVFSRYKNFVLAGVMLVLFLSLSSCLFDGNNNNNNNGQSSGTSSSAGSPSKLIATIIPKDVPPQNNQNSANKGPVVISNPTLVPGGRSGSQQIVLNDRTLIINSVSTQKGANASTTLINLDVAVQNTSNQTIMNQSTFFLLVGAEGDSFGYQYNSSDNFYGSIAAHTTRDGTIMFQVPAAATGLRLMYHPEIAAETAIISLKAS